MSPSRWSTHFGWPFFATLPVAFIAAAVVSIVFERAVFRRLYRATRSRPGAADHRHRLHVGRRGGLYLRHHPAAGAAAGLSAQLDRSMGERSGGLPALPDRDRPRRSPACWSHARIHALRRARCAPPSTTSAWRAASASTSIALFAITFALGSGLAGLGGALAIEIVGLDPSFALTYLDLCADRRRRSAGSARSGLVCRRDAARHQRHRRQILRAAVRRLSHLSGDDLALLMWRPTGLFGRR